MFLKISEMTTTGEILLSFHVSVNLRKISQDLPVFFELVALSGDNGFCVFCSMIGSIPVNFEGYSTKCWWLDRDELAFHPRGGGGN